MYPVQAQFSPHVSPRLSRRKLFAERVSCSIALNQKMYFAIDPERPDRRMVQMFPKNADDTIANANMRCLNGFGAELIACYFQTEPFSVELDDRFVGKNQLCCSGDPFRKQLMQREPGRREDHRIEVANQYDGDSFDLWCDPHALDLLRRSPIEVCSWSGEDRHGLPQG